MLFAIAAGTDWVDGYWARRYGQVTQLGRILDPFADKIIICGTFIFLAAVPPSGDADDSASEVTAWMAVVVVAREMLVTALRSFFEEHGADFSAKWSGKWKMVANVRPSPQASRDCGTMAITRPLGPFRCLRMDHLALRITVWTAVGMTVSSGWVYVRHSASRCCGSDAGRLHWDRSCPRNSTTRC